MQPALRDDGSRRQLGEEREEARRTLEGSTALLTPRFNPVTLC